MVTKKAFSLEEVILYLESLEMLDMIYKVEKFPVYYCPTSGQTFHDVWLISYEQGQSVGEPTAIQFED